MFFKTKETLAKHIKNNSKKYFFLVMVFVAGVSAGAFTVNGLSSIQRDELKNYFQGFIQLMQNQNLDSAEIFKISTWENLKIVVILWVLGVSIIGIPFIYVIMGMRGFVIGFSSGFIIKTLGIKGIIFTLCSILPKEIIIIPCLIALGVNGINFSLSMIRRKTKKQISKENIKNNFLSYCCFTFLFCAFIFTGILVEAYFTPVIVRILTPVIV